MLSNQPSLSNPSIIVEKGVWHAMTAAPPELGWPGHAVIFEMSGHYYDPLKSTKVGIMILPEDTIKNLTFDLYQGPRSIRS